MSKHEHDYPTDAHAQTAADYHAISDIPDEAKRAERFKEWHAKHCPNDRRSLTTEPDTTPAGIATFLRNQIRVLEGCRFYSDDQQPPIDGPTVAWAILGDAVPRAADARKADPSLPQLPKSTDDPMNDLRTLLAWAELARIGGDAVETAPSVAADEDAIGVDEENHAITWQGRKVHFAGVELWKARGEPIDPVAKSGRVGKNVAHELRTYLKKHSLDNVAKALKCQRDVGCRLDLDFPA